MKTLLMMIEDERVEDCLLKERPGYLEFIDMEKNHEYKRFINSTSIDYEDGSREFQQFFVNLYKLIRFPENVDVEFLNKYQDLYDDIGHIITPLPSSSKEVCIVAEKVYSTIRDAFKLDEMSEEEKAAWFDQLLAATKMGEMGFEMLLYGLDDDTHEIPETAVASDIKDRSTGELLESLTDGTTVEGSSKDTFFTLSDNDRDNYSRSLNRVRKYIPMIKKIVRGHDKNYDFNILGCRSGLLDTNKLAEAYQGIPQVYVRKGQVRTNKTTVCILIDESGSMGWGVHGGLSRADLARDTAILLNESLKSIPGIDLYIYGHSGDIVYSGATEINIYREGKKERAPFALGKVRARSENRDGTAILETAKRVRKFTNDPVLMFIISDGSPSADFYRGYGAVKDTADKVKQVEQMGFNTVAITICSYRASEMYPRNIDLSDDLSVLPLALGKIVKKLIIQDKKTTTTTV
jgi:nitric oxide reductase activation protein